jgi:hypothetical protein
MGVLGAGALLVLFQVIPQTNVINKLPVLIKPKA